jgi:transcription initiation factor IIF auxiliary subunit
VRPVYGVSNTSWSLFNLKQEGFFFEKKKQKTFVFDNDLDE